MQNGAPSNLDRTIRRRHSREWAMQMLFALDVAPVEGSLDDFFAAFWEQQQDVFPYLSSDPEAARRSFEGTSAKPHRAFAESLVEGVRRHQTEIDAMIEERLEDWSMQRLGGVDRNVLRVAFYELFFQKDTPPAIIINEAVDIAKYFSTRESGKFVNGVLNQAAKAVDRPAHYQAETPPFGPPQHPAPRFS